MPNGERKDDRRQNLGPQARRVNIHPRENWHRDVYAVFLTVVIAFTLNSFQTSRWDTAYRSCQETNDRNISTKAEIAKQQAERIAKLPLGSPERKQIKDSSAGVNFIIDRLAPFRKDCSARATQLVGDRTIWPW